MKRSGEQSESDGKKKRKLTKIACLTTLPNDLIRMLAFQYLLPEPKSPPTDIARLSQTCIKFRALLSKKLNAQALVKAEKLVQDVVYGKKDDVKKELDTYPALLYHRATVMDYCGRIIDNVSAYEASLGALDSDMTEMIASYFAILKNGKGEEERKRQYKKVFPEGKIPELEPYDFSGIVEIITQSSPKHIPSQFNLKNADTPISNAINQFRKDMCPGTVSTGLHFNHQTLIKAYDIFYQEFNNWNWKQRDLFWNHIILYILHLVPTNDAQAFAQGLYHIVKHEEVLKRSLVIKCVKYAQFYPHQQHYQVKCLNYAAKTMYPTMYYLGSRIEVKPIKRVKYVKKFYNTKIQHPAISQQPEQFCVIL